MSRDVLVYLDLDGEPVLVGRLWARDRKGRESASFEYDSTWLKDSRRFALEPGLAIGPGQFHTVEGRAIFGSIGDSSPDHWGRLLMKRAERARAKAEGRAPRTLREVDFLLLVTDEARQGAVRFAEKAGGPYLAESGRVRIPPLVKLPKLLSASDRVVQGDEADENDADFKLLLAPGSSLGGARPKASVRDAKGSLLIAKFPSRVDEYHVILWEALALTLAERAKLLTPEWTLHRVAGKGVLLLHRFDRVGTKRITFLSAMSMLGAGDGDTRSYLEMVDALRQYGAQPKRDMEELWRRLVFNVLISNTDDHLRNHGFLWAGQAGWVLSPVYDINPVPIDVKPRILSTEIQPGDAEASLETAFRVAPYFQIAPKRAKAIAREVGTAVAPWRQAAESVGISQGEVSRMQTAFEHEDLDLALKG